MIDKGCRVVHDLDKSNWLKFVKDHPNGNIFHTPFMYNVFQKTKNYKPYIFATVDSKTGEIYTLLLSVQILTSTKLPRFFTSRFVILGGVLHKKNSPTGSLMKLLKVHDDFAKNKCLFTEFRNKEDTIHIKKIFKACDYEFVDELNYLICLEKSPDKIFETFLRSKRKNVRKAMKMGITVEEVKDLKLLSILYEILEITYKRLKVPLVDISLFENLFEVSQENDIAKFNLIRYKDYYIGARIILTYKGIIYDWYAGANSDYLPFRPNEAAIWHAIKWGSINHYNFFDFGGAGNPNKKYGVRDFKARFNGKPVNYGRYIKIYHPLLYKMSRMGYFMFRRFI